VDVPFRAIVITKIGDRGVPENRVEQKRTAIKEADDATSVPIEEANSI
jgi:hypothetical protein